MVAFEALRFLSWVERAYPNVDTAALRRASGLPAALDGEARIGMEPVYALWGEAAAQTSDPGIGVRFAASSSFEDFGILGLAMMTCTTAREALSRVHRYQHLLSTSGRWEIKERDGVTHVEWHRDGKRTLGHRLANETVLAELVAGCRQLLGTVDPLAVAFRHPSPADTSEHRLFFRCPLRWSAPSDEVLLPSEILSRSPRGRCRPLLAQCMDERSCGRCSANAQRRRCDRAQAH